MESSLEKLLAGIILQNNSDVCKKTDEGIMCMHEGQIKSAIINPDDERFSTPPFLEYLASNPGVRFISTSNEELTRE